MPPKIFRKFLPNYEKARQNRHIARLGPRVHHPNLWHLNRRSVAGGVAAGLFAGLVPGSNPVQFLVASVLALGFRVNLPIAVAVTLYSNPFTVVPLYYCAYKLGQLVLLKPATEFPAFDVSLQGKGLLEWIPSAWHWLATAGKPLLAGLPMLALLAAFFGYIIVDVLWQLHVRYEWQQRRKRRMRTRTS
jgi:uncharacterized protein (DUF2062 family)